MRRLLTFFAISPLIPTEDCSELNGRPQTTSRVVRELRLAGRISLRRESLSMLDRAKLVEIARFDEITPTDLCAARGRTSEDLIRRRKLFQEQNEGLPSHQKLSWGRHSAAMIAQSLRGWPQLGEGVWHYNAAGKPMQNGCVKRQVCAQPRCKWPHARPVAQLPPDDQSDPCPSRDRYEVRWLNSRETTHGFRLRHHCSVRNPIEQAMACFATPHELRYAAHCFKRDS